MSRPNEAKTRKELIDPALQKAAWNINNPNQVGLEIPVDGTDAKAWSELKEKLDRIRESGAIYNAAFPSGVSDYALYRPNGDIIAVVEAKKTSIDPRLAQTQAEFYVSQIEKCQSFRPFAFMTNGRDIYFLDAGQANKRLVSGFFSPDDLDNLLFIRQHRQPLSQVAINPAIIDRLYQQEAVRRVCEAFEQKKKRKALLVMATGTGKTRTVMSLIDLFLRANEAKHILFVADRDALVQQALKDGFTKYIPNEPCERIFSHSINTTSRLYVVTLQTLNACFQSFTPAFFDLIIFDEVHRSIFNKWNEVLQYFDSRLIVYWLLGTSVRKITNFAFSSSLFTWHVKLDRGKSRDVLLALPEKQPQAYEKNMCLREKTRLGRHAKDGRESFHRYLRTEQSHRDTPRPSAVLLTLFVSL